MVTPHLTGRLFSNSVKISTFGLCISEKILILKFELQVEINQTYSLLVGPCTIFTTDICVLYACCVWYCVHRMMSIKGLDIIKHSPYYSEHDYLNIRFGKGKLGIMSLNCQSINSKLTPFYRSH